MVSETQIHGTGDPESLYRSTFSRSWRTTIKDPENLIKDPAYEDQGPGEPLFLNKITTIIHFLTIKNEV